MENRSTLNGPLKCLRPASLNKLAQLLNPRKILPTPDGHLRDWRGVAELLGFDALSIQNFARTQSPFVEMIYSAQTSTVQELLTCLEIVDRFDILDDCKVLIEQDLVAYNDRIGFVASQNPDALRTSVTLDDLKMLDSNFAEYDALVLFAEEDRSFAEQVMHKMEKEYNLRLCVKDRDLLAGLPFEHRVVTDLIENRCRFVLPIFSPVFLQSEDNKFVVNFAEALGIDKGCRKIVPCLYKPCTLPKTLSYYSRLDFTRANAHFNFWDKMYRSLATPPGTKTTNLQPVEVGTEASLPQKNKTAVLKTSDSDSALLNLNKIPAEVTSSRNWFKKIISKPKKDKTKRAAAALAS